ncbi:MAG: hypothetical protein HKO66_03915 [Saprospiraceae bacterium]|nr:hypothetical protein [Bacteroidia bacterium]NNL91357.1 hypothetical protein [Saprospiraceae bacterium]
MKDTDVQDRIEKRKSSFPRGSFLYAISRLLERTAYYGLRSMFVLYLINGFLQMEDYEAVGIYGWFSTAIVLSAVVGAILGDLIIGNRIAIIVGIAMQAMGASLIIYLYFL